MATVHGNYAIDNTAINDDFTKAFNMITETIGTKTIKRHDDIGELICENYNLFNEYALIDSEAGHTMDDIAKLFHKVDAFFASGKIEDALQARKNLHQVFYHIYQKNNFPALQWASLLHSIDGEPITDFSADNLKNIIAMLSKEGLTQGKVAYDVEQSKKKFARN